MSLIKLDKSVTLTLKEFKDMQRDQCEHALTQLNALRDKIIEIAWESCAVSRYEPPRGKTNNVVSEQVRHKSSCTSIEKS